MQKEFIVNQNITLKLEKNKTNIYIKGELFQQCKFLLINIPVGEFDLYTEIDSIDDAVEILDTSLEGIEDGYKHISAEEEFWAHSSNLQMWYENDYDTRLLHSNLAFALLKKLYEIGDPIAKKKLKEEIANRFLFGNKKIQDFLIEECYLDILSKEELLSLVNQSDIIIKLEKSLGRHLGFNTIHNPLPRGIVIENAVIKWLSLDDCGLKKVPEIIKELKSLEGIVLGRNSLVTLPDWIGDFNQLEHLDVSSNQLEKIPESIGNLQKLKRLDLHRNKLRKIPDSIGNLNQLEVFYLNENIVKELPESIGRLIMVKDLTISNNLIESIPDSIGNMSSLKMLNISENPIKKLPSSITKLKNLISLFLKGIDKNVWNLPDYMKKRIYIYE